MNRQSSANFPITRPRRLRQSPAMRNLVRENRLHASQLVLPLFVRPGKKIRKPIPSMPGVFQLSLDELLKEVEKSMNAGVAAVLLFGIPTRKDSTGSGAHARNGIIQTTVRKLKSMFPELLVITDVCLCEYTTHGHCGLIHDGPHGKTVANDPTLRLLAKSALSHAEAGADIVAPSDMMDGRVAAIRAALDKGGFSHTPIMSYAAKFASAFYGPFRDAAESAPKFGDRRSYQMDAANGDEAIREVALDIQEGADIVMVKPGIAYLDIVRRVKETFRMPTAIYQVSGEYSMIKAAAQNGWIDERGVVMESLLSMHRAGADILITYSATDIAHWLKEE